MNSFVKAVTILVLFAVLAAGCATGRAFARGEAAGKAGDWEAAVGFYRQALENDPDRPDYKIALERAMVATASHVRRARPAVRSEPASLTRRCARIARPRNSNRPTVN